MSCLVRVLSSTGYVLPMLEYMIICLEFIEVQGICLAYVKSSFKCRVCLAYISVLILHVECLCHVFTSELRNTSRASLYYKT